MAVRDNVTPADGASMNVYTQMTEPEAKEGIWIQTSVPYKNVVVDTASYYANEWVNRNDKQFADIPYNFYYGSAVAIGTDVYLLGGSGSFTTCYKYDTLTNTYTYRANIPYNFYYGSAVAVGTNIYLFGSNNSSYSQYAYKYDTLTDTYTSRTSIPYTFSSGSAVAIDTNIYLFGSSVSGSHAYSYKYDTLTDTYKQLANIPYNFYSGAVVEVGTDVYLFGGSSSTTAYKYDTLTNTYTYRANIPYNFSNSSAVAVGTNIYLFGSSTSSYTQYAYKYDTLSNKYEKLTNIPISFCGGSAVFTNSKIWLFGTSYSSSYYKYLQVYSFISKIYEDYDFVILRNNDQTGTYKTQLFGKSEVKGTTEFNRFCVGFNNANIFYNGDLAEYAYPTYYGDGKAWVKFKN